MSVLRALRSSFPWEGIWVIPYTGESQLIKIVIMPMTLRPELPLTVSRCDSDSRTNDLLWLPKKFKINSTIDVVVDNPQ